MKHFTRGQKFAAFAVAACLVAASAQPSSARVHIGVNIGIPAPPVISFQGEPEVVVIPRTHVSYVPAATEYDMYQVGPYWYVNRDGYWYRSRHYRGPFVTVAYEHVPRAVIRVPATYRHHPLRPVYHGPARHGRRHNHRHDY